MIGRAAPRISFDLTLPHCSPTQPQSLHRRHRLNLIANSLLIASSSASNQGPSSAPEDEALLKEIAAVGSLTIAITPAAAAATPAPSLSPSLPAGPPPTLLEALGSGTAQARRAVASRLPPLPSLSLPLPPSLPLSLPPLPAVNVRAMADALAGTATAGSSAAAATLAAVVAAVFAARGGEAGAGPVPDPDPATSSASSSSGPEVGALIEEGDRPTRPPAPVEWYIADDPPSCTRIFVIQGSDNVASWRSNLTFDPAIFEDSSLNTYVHRGVYEAALALYEQLLPYITPHLNANPSGRVQFVGHSLGGSIATLLMLMLYRRGAVPRSSLRPVYTFGAAAVFYDGSFEADGGGGILATLGLPPGTVRNVLMHLDIVPRSFSCDWSPVSALLRRVSPAFDSHRCLQGPRGVMMYNPVGLNFILIPTRALGVEHSALPPGPGLWEIKDPPFWTLGGRGGDQGGIGFASAKAALLFLFNSPHPLDQLADPGAASRRLPA